MGFILMMNGANCTDFPPDVMINHLICTEGLALSSEYFLRYVNKKRLMTTYGHQSLLFFSIAPLVR